MTNTRYNGHAAFGESSFSISGGSVYRESFIYADHRLDVVTPDGTTLERDVIRHPGAVGIVAVDDAGRVLLERQYRATFDGEMWEIPAGKLDAEDTEPLDAAKRELLEETGVSADNWQLLAVVANSPGYSDEFSWVYLATGLHQGESAADGVEEAHMTLHWLPVDDALAMIDEEKLVHSLSVVGLTRARLKSIV